MTDPERATPAGPARPLPQGEALLVLRQREGGGEGAGEAAVPRR